MADIKESAMTKITSMSDGSYIRMLDASGNSVLIDKNSFIEAIRTMLPFSTSFSVGVSGGSSTRWLKCCAAVKGAYNPIRLLLDYGVWNSTTRQKHDVTIAVNGDIVAITGGVNDGRIGYVVTGNIIRVYIKLLAAHSVIGLISGALSVESLEYLDSEPSGIIYI